MGITRPKKKPVPKPHGNATTVPALLEKAQSLIVECDYDLALRFARRILETEPGHVEAREILGISLLETGDLDGAKQVCMSPALVVIFWRDDVGCRHLLLSYVPTRRPLHTCIWHNCPMTIHE